MLELTYDCGTLSAKIRKVASSKCILNYNYSETPHNRTPSRPNKMSRLEDFLLSRGYSYIRNSRIGTISHVTFLGESGIEGVWFREVSLF